METTSLCFLRGNFAALPSIILRPGVMQFAVRIV